MTTHHLAARGFTLLEMVVALTILGLLAMVAVPLLRAPMVSHMDTARRSALATELDTVVNRLRADFAQALPQSVRRTQVGGRTYLEYLEVRAVGRYRHQPSNPPTLACPAPCATANDNDAFSFGTCNETCFTTLGPLNPPVAPVVGGDWVVVLPQAGGGNPYIATGAQAIKSRLQGWAAGAAENRVTVDPHTFVNPSANARFHLVATPVTYECNPATRRLTRYWGYGVAQTQPTAFAAAVARAPLSTRVAFCDLPDPVPAGTGQLVTVRLRLSQAVAGANANTVEAVETLAQFSVRER